MRPDENGREMLLYYIQPGESCIMSFLGGIHHETGKVTAVVEEDAELLFIPVGESGGTGQRISRVDGFYFSIISQVNAVAFQKLDHRILHLRQQKSKLL